MNPKQFLVIGGIILLLVGILGFVGILGPTASDSIFGATWYFDNAENWAHAVLGIVALLAAFVLPMNMHKPLVIAVGILALLFGVYSLFGSRMIFGANLENPMDTILHLAIGILALWASMQKSMMSASGSSM